jgi:AcrR family transcriptional regulator
MAARVKPKRQYNSPRRQEQAAATRRSILEAAQRLFERDGYPATTMEMIAAEAGVALKTVYVVFATKSGLLRGLWDFLLKGDQQDAGVADRAWYREVLDEPDPRQQLRLNARNARAVKERVAALLRVIRDASPGDADLEALWDLIQTDFYANQRVIVESLHEKRALQRGLEVSRATDILWTLNHLDVWLLLVETRGWTPDEFEEWFADTTCAQLLKPPRRTR